MVGAAPPSPDEEATLRAIAECLKVAGIDYMVVGSVAMGLYAEQRFTRDLDIVLDVNSRSVKKLIVALKRHFVVDPEMAETEVARGGMFNIFHSANLFKVDLIPLKSDELSRTQFRRRLKLQHLDYECWVASPEDVAVSKLKWARDSHSDYQLRDVRNILATVEGLDLPYIERWAGRLGLEDLLDEIKADIA